MCNHKRRAPARRNSSNGSDRMIFRRSSATIGNGRPRQYSQGPRDVVLECWQTVWSVRVLSTLTGEGFKIIRSFGRDRRHRARNLCENSSSARFGPCLAPRRRGNRQQSVDFVSGARAVRGACDCSMHGACFDFATRRTPITPQIAALGPLYCVQINSA